MILNKIKFNYYDNLLEKFIQNNQSAEIKEILLKLIKSNNTSYLNLIHKYLYILTEKEKFHKVFDKKLVWVNSFDIADCNYINTFISYVYQQHHLNISSPKNYYEYLNEIIAKFNLGSIHFSNLVDSSYLYQYLIGQLYQNDILVNSSSAFFESNLKRYFTHHSFTKFFIYVVKNPTKIYLKRKNQNLENPMHGFLSSHTDYLVRHKVQENLTIEENIQNWSTNVSSWTNSNVLSTFRGYILKIEDLYNNPREILAEIIGNMIQAGVQVNLDYELIDHFLKEHPLPIEENQFNTLSNKELKLFKRDLHDVAKKNNYSLD